MNRLCICFLFCFALAFSSYGKDKKEEIDSLKLVIDTTSIDTLRLKALTSLTWRYMFNQTDSALLFAKDAIALGAKTDNTLLLGKAINAQGTAFGVKGLLDSSKFYFEKANQLAIANDHTWLIAVSFNNIGLINNYDAKPDSAIFYYKKALTNYKKLKKVGEEVGDVNNNIGLIYQKKGDYNNAILHFKEAIHTYDSLKTKSLTIANPLLNLGITYKQKGDYKKAMDSYLKARKFLEKDNAESVIYANVLNGIGALYNGQKDYDKALEFFLGSVAIYQSIGNKSVTHASTLNNIGSIYRIKGKNQQALEHFVMALNMQEEMGESTSGMPVSLKNIGILKEAEGKLDSAIIYFERALALEIQSDDSKGIIETKNELGLAYLDQGELNKALAYCKASLSLAEKIGLIEGIQNSCECLSSVYEKKKNTAEAYKYYKKYVLYRDSLYNQENTKAITQKAMQYEFQRVQYKDSLKRAEQAQRLALEQKQKDLEKEAEIQRQRVYTVAGGVGFVLMLGLAFVLFRGYKNKQRANEIISAQKAEVESQKDAVEQQKSIIEEKNQEIVDSINYAKRIQNTILPSTDEIKKWLPESFVMFEPKDIVSGDFYFCDEKDGYIFFAAVDCTGHGVPGALVSVVGYNGLNRAIHEYGLTKPSAILDKLNEIVKDTFSHTNDNIKDGMDLTICRLDLKNNELQFAGANNPLYLVREKADESLAKLSDRILELEDSEAVLYEIKADKQPIGSYEYSKPFNNQSIQLQSKDTIYVFSDGFADQFGGEKGKKYMYKPFKRLLLSLFNAQMKNQKKSLDYAFSEWKGALEQIDDVCVLECGFELI